MRKTNHYDYLDQNLPGFFEKVGIDWESNRGIIVCHGDKAYSYRCQWEAAGIHFYHGVALYLLSYCYPFDLEVRETEQGWVSPQDWVIQKYPQYQEYLPPVT